MVFAFAGWAFATLAIIAIFNTISFESFFVVCLIGFITITMLSGPFTSRTRSRSRANLVILAGVIIFFTIILNKALDVLGIRLF